MNSTTALSLARLISITRVDMTDLTYNVPTVLVLGTAEPVVGIICVCVPMLKPLLRNSGLTSTNGGSSNNTPGGPLSRSREWSKVADDNVVALGNQDDSSETELRQLPEGGYKAHAAKMDRRGPGSNRFGSKNTIRVEQEWDVTTTSKDSL